MKREVGSVKVGVPKLLYSRKDVASALSLSARSVDYLIESGKLASRKIGARVLVPVEEVERVARQGVSGSVMKAA
jgi:hypothetical protein